MVKFDFIITFKKKQKTTINKANRRADPHPLQDLCQMCIQSVLPATDLLHVPLELLNQNLQFTDALVCFVSCTAKRPGLNKDQINTIWTPLETFLHRLDWYMHIYGKEKKTKKAKYWLNCKMTWKTLPKILFYRQCAKAKKKKKKMFYLACHVTVFLFEVIIELFQPLTFSAQQGV